MESSVYLDHSLRGLGSRSSPTGGNPESWKNDTGCSSKIQLQARTQTLKKGRKGKSTHRHTEMHSIISVDFLCDPPYGWVLDEFVALPLQTDSFLCICPTVWIHPTTECQRETMTSDSTAATVWGQNHIRPIIRRSEALTN